MDRISPAWIYPLILVAGLLQAWGPPMNGALRTALVNPWLASLVSFLPIVALLGCAMLCMPRPLPTVEGLTSMPWWAPLGGLIGAVAVVAGLLFVGKVGAGAFAGLTITANILMSLTIDHFGLPRVEPHPMSAGRIGGAVLMVIGVALISKFRRGRARARRPPPARDRHRLLVRHISGDCASSSRIARTLEALAGSRRSLRP